MPISPDQIPGLTADLGLKFAAKAWGEIPEEYLRIARVMQAGECSDAPWGTIESSFSTNAVPLRRRDGAPIEEASVAEDYVRLGANRLFSRKMGITQRDTEGEAAQSQLVTKMKKFMLDFNVSAKLKRADLFANVLIKGSLTAGDADTFNNTYDNAARSDSYPKFIYDGAPFFGTHTAKHSGATYSNYGTQTMGSAGLDATRTLVNNTNAFDEAGRRIQIVADTVIVPQGLEYTASQTVNSQKDPSTANGGSNPLQNRFEVFVLPQLADTDGWYCGVRGKGIVFIDGGTPSFESVWDPHTKTTWIIAEDRHGCFVDEWRYWAANRTPQS